MLISKIWASSDWLGEFLGWKTQFEENSLRSSVKIFSSKKELKYSNI